MSNSRLQMQKRDRADEARPARRRKSGSQFKMAKWERINGRTWARKHNGYTAYVQAGRGGWHGLITDQSGAVVGRTTHPAHRSRTARHMAQRILLKLPSAISPRLPLAMAA